MTVSVGIYLGVKRESKPALPPPPASSTPSAANAEVTLPRPATQAEVQAAIQTLERQVKRPAGDPKNPWALAHGLVAFGADFTATDGKKAVDVIASYAEPLPSDGGKLYLFPEKKDDNPVEPHRFLLVKTLLEVGVPLDRKLVAANGDGISLGRLVADLRKAAVTPVSDADFHQVAWQLSALVSAQVLEKPDAAPPSSLTELLALALDRLERDQRVVSDYSGPPDHAFDDGTALNRAKRDKTGIYGHSCGGLHLVQAVTLAAARIGDDATKRRMRKQIGVLLYRYELERAAYASLLARHPEQGLLIRVQQLKFHGHVVETLALAKSSGLLEPGSQGAKAVELAMRTAAADVALVVRGLDEGGVYERLDAIRKDREQTYLDLIGDACHALHGLRQTLDL